MPPGVAPEFFKRYLDPLSPRRNENLSAYSYIHPFLWQDHFCFEIKEIGGAPCLLATNSLGSFLWLPPLTEKLSAELFGRCFDLMRRLNGPGGVSRIENLPARFLDEVPLNEFAVYNRGYEYLYYRPYLAALPGAGLKSKRWSCHVCERESRPDYGVYCSRDREECRALYGLWRQQRAAQCQDDLFRGLLEDSLSIQERCLAYSDELGLTGRVVRVGGRIAGYTFGYSLNERVFCVLLETVDLTVRGLPAFLFRELCRDEAVSKHLFINTLDDSGLENLRKTKMSYRPALMCPSFTVTRP